jgi:hypothetical protein
MRIVVAVGTGFIGRAPIDLMLFNKQKINQRPTNKSSPNGNHYPHLYLINAQQILLRQMIWKNIITYLIRRPSPRPNKQMG